MVGGKQTTRNVDGRQKAEGIYHIRRCPSSMSPGPSEKLLLGDW
jgi:hypothetical protein